VQFSVSEELRAWTKEFSKNPARRFVFGCNQWGAEIQDVFGLAGFIDDVVSDTTYCGVPVIRSSEIPHDALVVSAVLGIRPLTAKRKLLDLKINAIDYFDFYRANSEKLTEISYWKGVQLDKTHNSQRYQELKNSLADSESLRTLDAILQFRESCELSNMNGFTDRQIDQYFESFLTLGPESVFYDVGAFDGETSAQFARRAVAYKEIHVFEPIASTYEKAKKNLSAYPDVHLHQFGLGAEYGEYKFESNGSASRPSDSGNELCVIKPLDSVELTDPTFIKVDIEGAEMDFLYGASKTLGKTRPTLAIACYHDPEHIWSIFDFVSKILPTHAVYLRHYTEGFAETDLFFVPTE
jgi:FkbM family methyltransferase